MAVKPMPARRGRAQGTEEPRGGASSAEEPRGRSRTPQMTPRIQAQLERIEEFAAVRELERQAAAMRAEAARRRAALEAQADDDDGP